VVLTWTVLFPSNVMSTKGPHVAVRIGTSPFSC
jgi:hypothetical protein